MRTIRFTHLPTQQHFLVATERGSVYRATADAATFGRGDQIAGEAAGVRTDDLLAAGALFEALWLWPAPGTRFPPSAGDLPTPWFEQLGGRLNRAGPEGDLSFAGYADASEERRLASGAEIPVRRSALEQHLSALDYRLRGELGLRDLYRAFRGSLFPAHKAALKALGAYLVFGRGRPIEIARIGERRAAARTAGYDRAGDIDPEVLAQFERLFAASANDEIEQQRMRRFIALNFRPGRISMSQWESFFVTCAALNHRPTVTWRQLRSLFAGSFAHIAASRADPRGRRPLEQLVPSSANATPDHAERLRRPS